MRIKVVALVIFFSELFTLVFSVLNFLLLTTSLSYTSPDFFKSAGTVLNLPTSKSSSFVSKLFKLVGKLVSLLMSSLPTSAFKAIKHFLEAKSDLTMPLVCSNYFSIAQFDNSNTTLTLSLIWLYGSG